MGAPDPEIVIPLFEALLKQLPGLYQAYGSAPFAIVDTPSAIVIAGPASPLELAGGDDQAQEGYERRKYSLMLLVAPAGVGLSGEVITRVNPYYGSLRNLIVSHPDLGSPTSGVFWLEWMGDTGLQIELEVGGIKYAGTVGSVQVTGRVRVQYAQGE